MNKVYKVIYNFAKGQYEVVSELAKSAGKKPQSSVTRSFSHSRKVLTRSILAALLVFGSACGVSATGTATIHDGATVSGGTNILVQQDGQGVSIDARNLATSSELDNLTTTVGTKANQSDLTTLSNTVGTRADGHYIGTGTNPTHNSTTIAGDLTSLDNQVYTNTTNIGSFGTDSNHNYISTTGSVDSNLSALDGQVHTNATNIATNTTAIGTLDSTGTYHTITTGNSINQNLSALDAQVYANTIAVGNAVQYDAVGEDGVSRITLKSGAGSGTTIANLADGTVSATSTDAINGRVLYNTVGTVTPGNYITATTTAGDTTRNTTVAENLSALDTAIGKVTADGNYITASTTTTGGVTTPTSVSDNLTKLDTQVKNNADAIGSSSDITSTNYISAGTADNPSSINKNLSALDSEIGAFNTSGYHYIQQETSGNTVASDLGALDTNLHNLSQALGITDTTNYTGIKYFHANSQQSGTTSDDSQAIGEDAVAIGKNATAGHTTTGEDPVTTGANAVAIGNNTSATQNGSVAIGGGTSTTAAQSTGTNGVAIGTSSKAQNANSVALGNGALARSNEHDTAPTGGSLASSVAVGNGAQANSSGAVAMGDTARSSGYAQNSVTIGQGAVTGAIEGTTADDGTTVIVPNGGKESVSIGSKANARGNSSIALGDRATVFNNGTAGTVLSNSIAIGTQAATVSDNATAIGNEAAVRGASTGGIAIGNGAKVNSGNAAAGSANAIALGTGATANGAGSLAAGNGASASQSGSLAAGNSAAAGGANSVAIGSSASAAPNRTVAIGPSAGIDSSSDTGSHNGSHVFIGDTAGQRNNGQQNVAIGYHTGGSVSSDHNVAIGSEAGTNITSSGADATNGKNVSIGYHANQNEGSTALAQSTALGGETHAETNGVAVGYGAEANSTQSIAIGQGAQTGSMSSDAGSVALGHGAQASGGNVAIGSGSTADYSSSTAGTGYLTGQAAPTTAVSVGTASSLRRITNVADGAADQDVATVAQLKKVVDETVRQVNNKTTASTSGSSVTYDNVGTSTQSTITLAGGDNGTVIHNVADGTLDGDAVNVKQLNDAVDGAKTHYYSVHSSSSANRNNDGATAEDSMAAGVNTQATGTRSVALGNNTEAQSTGSIALGTGFAQQNGTLRETTALSGYQYNTAIGAGAQAAGNNSMAIGSLATTSRKDGGASTDRAMAIGYSAGVKADDAVAVGTNASATEVNALAIGTGSQANAVSAGAIGTSNTVSGQNTYAIGSENGTGNTTTGTTAEGGVARTVSATNSGIFGNQNSLQGDSNRVVGNSNRIAKNTMPSTKTMQNIMVTGNSNSVLGDTKTRTAGSAEDVTGITITGSGNTVQARNNNHTLTDVQIVGNNNSVSEPVPEGASDLEITHNLSNVQILGSNVTATVGNSVYLGSGSAAKNAADDTTAGVGNYSGTTYTTADGTTAAFAGSTASGVVTVGDTDNYRRVQNVAAGKISAQSTDAVNGSQLYYATQAHHFRGDDYSSTDANSQVNVGSDGHLNIVGGADTDKLSTAGNIGVVRDADDAQTLDVRLNRELTGMHSTTYDTTSDGTTADYSTVVNNEGITINHTNTTHTSDTLTPDGRAVSYTDKTYSNVTLTSAGLNNGGNRITNVAQGVNDDDAVNVSQLRNMTGETYFKGDKGDEIEMASNDHMIITGGATGNLTDNNIAVTTTSYGTDANPTGVTRIQLASDLTGLNSVTTNNLTVNNGGDVNMGGNQVHNVADGTDTYDAVNVGQMNRGLNHLGNRINHVGANAAALAALHPLDFDPDDKWDFAAGYGNYRNANSVAVGAFYRPNEDTMFNVGASFGGGENMINAGFSIKLGQGNHVSTSRVAMAKEIRDMKKQLADQSAEIERLKSMHGIAFDPQKSALFPDVAENHWAYDYVTKLAGNGILEGYPDGEFKGDRMMTRYEFAAIVYRIVESGAGAQDPELSKLVKEFTPELKYIRIDTISHDKNGNPTIERVRVNKPVKQ